MKNNIWLFLAGVLSISAAMSASSTAWAASPPASIAAEDGPVLSPANLRYANKPARENDPAESQPAREPASETDAGPADAAESPAARALPSDRADDAEKRSESERKDDSAAGEQAEEATAEPSEKPAPPPKARHRLTQGEAALRDQVRQTLAIFQKQPFDTRQNTAGEIMDFCLPYGCATEITLYDNSGAGGPTGLPAYAGIFPAADSSR